MTQAIGPNQRRFINELISTKLPQGKEALQTKDGYCCLGIGCQLFFPEDSRACTEEDQISIATRGVRKWFGEILYAPKELVDVLALHSPKGHLDRVTPEKTKDTDNVDLIIAGYELTLAAMNDAGVPFMTQGCLMAVYPELFFFEPR